jgi:hypothetical protein
MDLVAIFGWLWMVQYWAYHIMQMEMHERLKHVEIKSTTLVSKDLEKEQQNSKVLSS